MNFKKRVNGSWVDTPNYIHNTSTDTITTLPADIYANSATATVGLKGQAVQSGTPTPENPIMPQGTGERTGNVMPAGEQKTVENNGITFSSDGKGKYTINGTATEFASVRFDLLSGFTAPISVSNGGQGTLSFFNTQSNNKVTLRFYNGTTIVDSWNQTPIRRTATAYNTLANKYINNVVITVSSGTTVDMTITPEFTNDGILPTEFEPYGYKIPISSASTTTPVYLGEVETTRKIRKIKLEVPSAVKSVTGGYQLRFDIYPYNAISYTEARSYCNIAEWDGNNARQGHVASGSNVYITQPIEEWSTVESATEWLSQHDVFVWYVLATETTGIVNEPLMKIGDYADTVSGITIPTITGKDTVDVDTTLKPSEVSLSYTGWHDATVEEWDGSDWK